MTKSELIDAIAAGVDGLTKAKAEQTLNVTISAIMEAVGKGDTLSLIGFGTFSQGERSERVARNSPHRRGNQGRGREDREVQGWPEVQGCSQPMTLRS